MQWNRDENGNPMSWHIPLEVQQISPTHGVIQLVQVPDQHQRIKIVTEENIQLTEVFNIEDITLDSFYVDYGVGIVRFHESQHGKMVKVNYYGRGVILISDSRIFHRDGENVTDTWDNILDRSKDALDLIESAGGLVGAMEKIDEKIEQGNATADRLENFITETQFYGYTITLSREAFVVKAKESGEVGKSEIATVYTDVIVYKGAKQIVPTLSIEQEYGCSFKVDGQRVKLTSMDINVIKANAVLNIDCGDGLVAQRKLEVTKVFDGVSQYSIEMTNPFYSFEANSEGVIEEEKTITCDITVTKANVDYTNYSISVQNAPRGLRYNIGASSVDFTCTTGSSLPSSGTCLVVVTIDGTSFNKTFTWNKTRKGQDAKSLMLIGGQILRYETPDYSDIPSPHRSTITAKIVGLSGTPKWYVRDNTTWNLLEGQVGTELTFMYNDTTIWGNRKETTIKCELEGYEDELTLVKLATGGNGADAITVILTNESHTVAIDNSGQVHESEIAKATTQVLAYQGIEGVTPILSKGACDGCDISIDGNTVRLHSLDNSFSTATAIINVNVNGVVVPKTWTISKAKQGTDGATGENGSSYILNVTDGTRSFTYSQINLDPRPSTSATFTGALYEDGTEIIEGVSYYWVARGHLQGSSVGKTFTPTIAKTFDESILNNDIQLTVTYKGNTVTQTIPISITKDANGLDWVQEWDDTKTEVRGNLILTPKIFAGSYIQEHDLVTGVAIGKDVLNDGNTIGVAGYQNNKTTFLLDTDGTLMVGNPFEQDSTGLYFDGENFTLKVNELSIEGSNVATTDDLTTQVDEAINSAKEEVKAEIEDVISQVNSLDSYMNNALKDGILDEVERNRLHTLYENITSEYLDTIAQYRSIAGNTHLTDEAMLAVLEGHFTTYLTCFEVLSDAFNTIMEAEVLTGEAVEAFKNAISDLRVASTDLLQSLTNALTCISESQANEIVTNAKLEIKQEIDDVSGALNSLETTMNGDFKSGLISTMNLTTLKSKLSQLETEKADIDGQYKGLVENSKLGATSRTNLSRAKGELDTAHDQLIIKINTAISDLLMTEAELTEINRLISVYGQKLKAYSEIAQQANADIALNLAQGAIQALNQEDIFNKLTNNGETQGIYLQNGKVYINGEYINSRNFKAVRNDGTETFKIDSEGNVHIRANSFHLVGDSVDTNLADKDYVDSVIESVATGSVNVMLSNEAQVIATSNNRVPFSNQTFSTKVGVYMGSTEVKDFTIGAISSANGISVSVNQSTKTINFSVSTETTITANNGSFTIPVSFNGNTYSKKWTWAVSKQGNTGATGEQGAGAKAADIVTSSQVFKSTDGGLTFSPTTITMTPKLQNVTYNGWQYSTNGGSTWSGLTNSISGWSVSNGVLTISKDSSLFTSTVTSVTFRLNTNDSSVYDTMTIVKLYDVADLKIGGRNYLKGTTSGVTITGTNTSNQCATLGSLSVNCSELDGKAYVLTAKYKVTSSGTPSGTIRLQAGGDLWGGIQSNIATLSASNKSGVLKASGTLNLNGKTFSQVQVRCDNLNETIKIYDVKYELGNKPTDWTPAPEDVDSNINDVKDSLNSFQDTVNNSFKNGIIEQAEAKAIAQHLKTLDAEKADIDKEYSAIYSNANLTGSAKTNLASAKTSFDSAHASLKSTINTVISDGRVTSSESASVTSTFNTYSTQLGVYKQRVQEALDNISSGKVDKVEIGGRNLARKGSVVKYNSNDSATTVNDANFTTDGSATISRTAVMNEGAMIDRYVVYDGGVNYVAAFKMRTTSGTVNSIHFYNGRGHKNSKVYIDGAYKGTMGQDLTFPNDTNYHKVEVRFEAVATDSSIANAQDTNHIIPQPMKGTASAYTIQILNLKIEKGNKATDWTPAPEDVKNHAEQSAQNAVNAQTQNSIFNKLTNNGQTQGIYLENSKIYINGEYIKANTLSADKVLVGDYTNYCQLTEQTPMSDKFNKYTHSDSTIWHEMKTINRDTRISRDYSCKGGEKFRVTGYVYGKVTSTTSGAGSTTQENTKFRVAIFGKKTDGSNFWIYGDSGDGASTGSIVQVNKIITLPSDAKSFYVALQIEGFAPFSGVARCRNIEVRRMNTGELIVDGSITAKSLHADVLSANSIVSTINGGSTNISGNRIRTGSISSNNGKSTINLDNGSMNLGATSDASYLQWTGSALNIKANSINIGSSSVATTTDVTNKINDIKIGGTNLIKKKSGYTNGYLSSSNGGQNNTGSLNDNQDFYTNDYFPLKTGESICFTSYPKPTVNSSIKAAVYIHVYDSSKVWQKAIYHDTNTANATVNKIYTATENCYIRFSSRGFNDYNHMAEYATKPSQWSPAPEDIDSAINNKANTADVYKKSEVYTKTETNTQINSAKDSITQSVSNTYETKTNVTTKLASLTVSGVNRALKTKGESSTFTLNNTSNQSWSPYYIANDVSGKKVVIAFDYVATDIVKASGANSQFQSCFTDTNETTQWYPSFKFDLPTGSGSGTIVSSPITFGNIKSGTQAQFRFRFDNMTGKIKISKARVFVGEKDLGWSPAPEDIETTVSVIEQRVTSAEQKITDTAITNTVKKSFYTKEETENAITSKGYATQSQVQQTAESIQFKFTQTGGYNLIRNGNPKPWHEENWWVSGNGWWYRENSNDLGIQTSDTNEAYAGCATFKVQPGVNYSVSCWLMAETNTKGTDVYFIGSANDDGAYTEVHHLYSGSGNGNWVNVKATFTTGSNINYGFIRIDNNGRKDTSTGHNTVVFFSEVQMVKGSEYYPQWSPNPNEVYDGIVQMDKNGIKVSTSNGGWTDFTSVGMNVYNKSSALSLGTRNGGLTYHGGGAYLGFTSESIINAYNTRGVSISTATDGAYISLGHSSATDPFGGFSSTPYLSIAKQDIGDSSSFYRRGVNVHTSLNLNTQNTNRAGTINFGTNNISKIFESSANNLCMFGNDGVALGYYEGSNNITKFKITEGSNSSTSYIDSYAHWRFNQWDLTNVGKLEVVSRLKMLGTSSIHFNADATYPSVMWHASGDGKLKIFGDNGVDIGYREGDTNRPIFKITEGEDGAYRLQSFSHWHFNNWNLDYVGIVHAQRFNVAGTAGSYYITKGTGDGADYTTYGCLFYTHNGLAFTANGGSVTVVVQGRSGRIMGKNAYYVNSSKCLKSDIRAVTSESEPMPVNLKQGEVVDETLTMEMIGDFIDTIGIRTYITDFEQEGATQRDVDPQQGHVLNLGYIADDLAHHPVFKYIGEKTPDNLYAINSNSLTTVALAGLQAERKERRKLEQRLQRLEAMLLKGDE